MSHSVANDPLTAEIRRHDDVLSALYNLLCGPHIHHGYWQGHEDAGQAQVRLVQRLARRLEITAGHRVLDIGSGLGGSACWLAKVFRCSVRGLTLSPAW